MEEGEVDQPHESQLNETKRVLVQALSEPDDKYNEKGVQLLKESWIDSVKAQLAEPTPKGVPFVQATGYADAALANQTQRGFAAIYMKHLGIPNITESIKDFVSDKSKISTIKDSEVPRNEKKGVRWVVDDEGNNLYLLTSTKIDGVQVKWRFQHVSPGPENTGIINPIFVVSR